MFEVRHRVFWSFVGKVSGISLACSPGGVSPEPLRVFMRRAVGMPHRAVGVCKGAQV